MAITLNALVMGKTKDGGKTPFVVDAYSADVTGNETLKAAASSGANYLTKISIQCPSMSAGEWVKINNDTTLMLGNILGDMGGGLRWWFEFKYPLKFSGAIKIDQQATDPIHVTIEGFEAG